MNRQKTKGFAALLMVMSLSISLMVAMIAIGDVQWTLRKDVQSLAERTQSQLAAESCRQLALLRIAEDPDYSKQLNFSFGNNIICSINSITRMNGSVSPFADRVIETSGIYGGATSTMISVVGITNQGIVEKYKYFK